MTHTTEADAVAELVKTPEVKFIPLTNINLASACVAAVPDGTKLQGIKEFLDPYRTAPERKKGIVRTESVQSFIDVTKRFKDGASAMFCHVTLPSRDGGAGFGALLQTVFDYNHPSVAGPDPAVYDHHAGARFGEHRASYEFPLSPEWAAWTAKDGLPMSSAEFGLFMEDRVIDLIEPSAAGKNTKDLAARANLLPSDPMTVLACSRGLKIRAEINISDVTDHQTGECNIQYQEKHGGEGPGDVLKVASSFIAAIPAFRGEQPWQLLVRLRYKREGTRLKWTYHLFRAVETFTAAIQSELTRVVEATKLPLYMGSPEKSGKD